MSSHVQAMKIWSAEQSPEGVVARKVLEDLEQAREESIWLQAIVEYQNELITLGGIPQPCAHPAAAADIAAFRARRAGGSS